MKIVIDMPEEKYEWIKKNNPNADPNSIVGAVACGTPLPKGHGRLKDIDKVERLLDLDKPDNILAKVLKNILESVPTIIEADDPKRRKGTPLEENDSGYNCENWIP